MNIQLSCPWCNDINDFTVDDASDELVCSGCSTRMAFAPDDVPAYEPKNGSTFAPPADDGPLIAANGDAWPLYAFGRDDDQPQPFRPQQSTPIRGAFRPLPRHCRCWRW